MTFASHGFKREETSRANHQSEAGDLR